MRYLKGLISVTDWIDAKTQLHQSELDINENRLNQYIIMTQIWMATGGDNLSD